LLKIANKQNIQTVVKIHNFRYLCANSYFSDNHVEKNRICNACGYKGRGVFKFNKYFSNSFFKSFLVIWHTKKMLKMLNQYPIKILLISNQHIQDIKKHVSNNNNLYKIYNPISISRNLNKYNHKSHYVVYAGRVTPEKGIFDLIDNWKQFKKENMELRIFGEVEQKLALDLKNFDKDIKIYGYLDLDKTLEQISDARALILPTLLYEGQPRVLCEAAALGVPSIFPNFGSLKEFFSDDYLLKYRQFNNLDFMSKLNLLHDEKVMKDSSEMVLRYSKEYFSKEVIVKKFIDIVNDK
jgi:glycosyltransferase involved in cell wall biosynthesis